MSTLPSPAGVARVSPGEQARLDACSLEPIRRPGAVQPHGAVIVVDAASFEVVHVSANSATVLGIAPEKLLARGLLPVVGADALQLFADILDAHATASNPARIEIGGTRFDAILHLADDRVIIDLEPAIREPETQSTAALYAAIQRLARIGTASQLWSETAREVQRVTRFDHVMVYHFHDDEHGEIVAEEVAEGMEPYLGLHYPASDIPPQARELYLRKLSRVIGTTADDPVALLSADGSDSGNLVDLSLSELRSVSPHHLQFMRNMGQASTMSFSLVSEGRLIGMITCAHRAPRRLPFVVRQGLEILAHQVALQLGSIASIAHLTRRAEVRGVRAALIAELSDEVDISETLLGGPLTILDFIPADGVAIRLGGVVASTGQVPTREELTALTVALAMRDAGLAFVTDSLPLDFPELAPLVPSVAGLLVIPVGGEGDFVAWFRGELAHTVHWLGDQSEANRMTPLSPRNSFSAWSQDVTGTAAAWDGLDADATELGYDLTSVLFRRAESRLAHVAMHDPLTGLPNRRLLMDRLEHALTKYARGEEMALLFIDLDGFKVINDTLGHEAGDAVLVRTARRLQSTVRAQDTVSRIGGDEFVVLCENTTAEEAETLAHRILSAIRNPSHLGYLDEDPMTISVEITASVGITAADLSFDAADVLRRADAAMYRAKQGGRDRLSR